jgi:DNA-binding response OmpR family regulator
LNLENIESKQLFEWKNVIYELQQDSYDLIIMDLWLWDSNWIDIIKKVRNNSNNIPILILTARDAIKDKISWFNSGADDYLIKPFIYEELLIRINALVRRNYSNKSEILIIWDLEIDKSKKEVKYNDNILHLSKLEYELLIYLINYRGKLVTKKELLEKVWWEYDDFFPSRTVDIYVWYLRKKINKNLIETVRWEWYLIK